MAMFGAKHWTDAWCWLSAIMSALASITSVPSMVPHPLKRTAAFKFCGTNSFYDYYFY